MIRKYYAIGIFAMIIIIGVLTGGCIEEKSPGVSDFSISNFKYEADSKNHPITWIPKKDWSSPEGNIIASFSMVISSTKQIDYKVYDITHNKDLTDYQHTLNVGDNIFKYFIVLDFLNQQPQLKICLKNKPISNENSYDVCRIESFPSPKIDIAINQEPITFTVSKKSYTDKKSVKEISITNTGNVPMLFDIYAPDSYSNSMYPKYYPQYATNSGLYLDLNPGQSNTKAFYPIFDGTLSGTEDTPIGTYESTGYVWALSPTQKFNDALFKKEFKIITIVNE